MKLWVDDIRPAPEGYVWCKSVKEAKAFLELFEATKWTVLGHGGSFEHEIKVIDMDHDAGEFAHLGGDYIRLLDWLEETGRNYPIRIHSMNPVGVANMRRIIERNGWKEVK